MRATHSLHRGRSRTPIVRVVPDASLYRVEWPDIGLSAPVNLTRAKDAARLWAGRRVLTEDRKTNAARALKSLDYFSWSSSPIAANDQGAIGVAAAS